MATALEIDGPRSVVWAGRRVFVTGATGFIGMRLVSQLLKMGALVYGFVMERLWPLPPHPALWQLEGDIRNRRDIEAALAIAEPELVFHLAALTQVTEVARMPAAGYATNVMGLVNLLEEMRVQGLDVKVIVASSDKALGDAGRIKHPYDASKAAADLVAQSYADFYGFDVRILRTANVYGPGDRHLKRIIPSTIWSILQGQRPMLRSDGTPVREYLYIDDAVEAYLRAAENWRRFLHPIVVAGERMNVIDLVRLILELTDSDLKPFFMETPYQETQNILLDPQATTRDLGAWTRTDLVHGLMQTIEWMRALRQNGTRQELEWLETWAA
jgi:CDP-glucose 4,6-dehydratase